MDEDKIVAAILTIGTILHNRQDDDAFLTADNVIKSWKQMIEAIKDRQ